MGYSHGQKSLSETLHRTLDCHCREWNTSWDHILVVLDDLRHWVEVQRRTSDKPKPKEE